MRTVATPHTSVNRQNRVISVTAHGMPVVHDPNALVAVIGHQCAIATELARIGTLTKGERYLLNGQEFEVA